jgi:hypothetical protein
MTQTPKLSVAVVAVAGLLVSACASTPTSHPPSAVATQPTAGAVSQPLDLNTHCGIRGAVFAGHYWVATPVLSDGHGNPPPGWGNPYQHGSVTIIGNRATFTGDNGQRATFRIATTADPPRRLCD